MSERPTRFELFMEHAALLLVAVMPTQVGVPIIKLQRATVTLTMADLLVWLLAGLLVARWLVSRRQKKLTWPPLHVWLIVVVAGISGAAWLNPGLGKTEVLTTIKELIQYVGLFVAAPVVFLSVLKRPDGQRRALWVWAGVTVIVVIVGATQAFMEAAGTAPDWLSATRHRELPAQEIDPRNVVGLFGSRTVYGIYLALSLPVLLALSMDIPKPTVKLVVNVALVVGVASVSAPGPFLALAVGLMVTSVLMASTGMGRAVGVAIGVSIVLFGLVFGPFRHEKLAWGMTEREEITEVVWVNPGEDADGFAPAPPDDELESLDEPADDGFAPAPPDDELESLDEPADDGFAPAPPDDELESLDEPADDGLAFAPPDDELESLDEPADDGFAPAPPDDELESLDEGAGDQAESERVPMTRVIGTREVLCGRYAEWGAALDMIGSRQRPVAVIGVGPGQYQEAIGGYYGVLPKGGKLETDFQNQYLVVLCELGVVGLATFVLFIWTSLKLAWRRLPRAIEGVPDALPGLIGSLWALIVANFFGGTLVRGIGVTIILIVSLIILWALPARGNEEQ